MSLSRLALPMIHNIVASVAALAAILPTVGDTMELHAGGRSGSFTFLAGNYSTQVAADTQGGMYVKATSVAASAGAWVRNVGPRNEADVKWFGAVGDGVATNENVAFQCAFSTSKRVFVSAGNYLFNGGVVGQGEQKVIGAGIFNVRIQRTGNWAAHTFQFGDPTAATFAGAVEFEGMLIEQLHPGFVLGTSSTMVDRLTGSQAHIALYGAVKTVLKQLWFQHGPYGIKMVGCVHSTISDIHSYGSWDNKTVAVSEQIAIIWLSENQGIPQHRFNTEIRMERLYIGGGGPSATRTITVGSTTYSDYENIGSKFGVLVQGCEGFYISGYIGGCGQDNIAIIPIGLCTMGNIDNIFLDECFGDAIRVYGGLNSATVMSNLTLGAGIRQNSQLKTRHGLRIDNAGWQTCFNLSLKGGVWANNLECAFYLLGLNGAYIAPGVVSAYNAKKDASNNNAIQCGAYIDQLSRNVYFEGGIWGGDVNVMAATGGSKFAICFAGAWGAISNVRAINGIAGGGNVTGAVAQTYPT